MKYVIQRQARAGNWYDSLGFEDDSFEEAVKFFRIHAAKDEPCRLVVRVDMELIKYADLPALP